MNATEINKILMLIVNEPFQSSIPKAVEQNSNQSETLVNQDNIDDSNENSQNQSSDTDSRGKSGLASKDKPKIDSKNDPVVYLVTTK